MTATDLIALVERSPAAVAAHDREAWLDIFAPDAAVNDPVGSRPHVGRAAIGRFYETFIAPNEITFAVDHDIVCGDTVVRDLHVTTRMSTGAEIRIPMHLRYELADDNGVLAVRGLFAHWELPSMVLQLASAGMPGAKAVAVLTPQLLGNQGVSGALGFSRGFVRVGRRAKRLAVELLTAIASFDEVGVHRMLADAAVELPGGGGAATATALLKDLPDLRWGKTLAAGRMVTVSIETGGEHGLALFEFDALSRRIERVRIYRLN
ncbi:nuclear transport factor 2 family protein [Aldersonia kunmingensis]|uniref:nuclear transport factor 2 family protein n=1 Tax=Aldersonia kunmingensis TaxID=408066 RepID=UPI001FDF7A0C|nr:nuclear transport factor 2 family protein [Aldersonia kunmingensis]